MFKNKELRSLFVLTGAVLAFSFIVPEVAHAVSVEAGQSRLSISGPFQGEKTIQTSGLTNNILDSFSFTGKVNDTINLGSETSHHLAINKKIGNFYFRLSHTDFSFSQTKNVTINWSTSSSETALDDFTGNQPGSARVNLEYDELSFHGEYAMDYGPGWIKPVLVGALNIASLNGQYEARDKEVPDELSYTESFNASAVYPEIGGGVNINPLTGLYFAGYLTHIQGDGGQAKGGTTTMTGAVRYHLTAIWSIFGRFSAEDAEIDYQGEGNKRFVMDADMPRNNIGVRASF